MSNTKPEMGDIRGFQTPRPGGSLTGVTTSQEKRRPVSALIVALLALSVVVSPATPANKAALEKHYDKFLVKSLAR